MHDIILKTGWDKFQTTMESFFKTGLGGPGMKGIGIAILVLGLIGAGVSFALHKFNPQSRFPGWVSCLGVGVAGAILLNGLETPIKIFTNAATWLLSLFGI